MLDAQARHGPALGVPGHHGQDRGSGTVATRPVATVADGRYTVRVGGFDRAGNPTVRDGDASASTGRSGRSAWARASFVPRAGGRDRLTLVLRRRATVSVAIYQGSTLVRRIWRDRALAAGTLRLDVERAGRLPGRSSSRAPTGSWSTRRAGSAPSRTSRTVTVRAP